MKSILAAFRTLGASLLLVFLTVGWSYLLPPPWNKFNVLLSAGVVLILWTESGVVVWLSFLAYLILELYSATPFGLMIFAGTLSLLFSVWLYREVFTNRSWYTALALVGLTVIGYHLLFLLGLSLLYLLRAAPIIPWRSILITAGWELLLTIPITAFVSFILFRFVWPHSRRSAL